MSAKSARRISFEDRAEQEDRLTGKHIRTLQHLQDLHAENERLKQRVAELELHQVRADKCVILEQEIEHLKKELLKCEVLHEMARDGKEKLHQMEQSCLTRIDGSNALLSAKHKDELMRVISEKLEMENAWLEEKQKLLEEIDTLQKTINAQKEQLHSLKCNGDENNKRAAMMVEAQAKIRLLESLNEQLKKEREGLEKDFGKSEVENDSLRSELGKLNTRVDVLQAQLKNSQKTVMEQSTEHWRQEMESLQQQVNSLQEENMEITKKKKELREIKEESEKTISVLEFNLQDSTQTLKLLYKERDLLKNRITCLLNEISALKIQTPESSTFADFVELKREYSSLREEHDKLLKKRNSKPNMLPSLKADSTTVKRRVGSGGSSGSRTGLGTVGKRVLSIEF